MGLDMYLTKHYYVKNWDHTKEEDRHHITIKKGNKISIIPIDRINTIIVDELYWRKANAIHRWFVTNIQKGKDNCEPYYVPEKKLRELLETIKETLANRNKAKIFLPTKEGFFFGNTEYNNNYWEDLECTKKGLEEVLKNNDSGEFYYKSSW